MDDKLNKLIGFFKLNVMEINTFADSNSSDVYLLTYITSKNF
jgi:hypothetical protein